MPSRDNAHLYVIALLALIWLATCRYGVGHVSPSGRCFAIGGGYIEYAWGWGWIRRKMICHSSQPPERWFMHKLCISAQRPYAEFYVGLWLPMACLLIHDAFRRLERHARWFAGNRRTRRGVTSLCMVLLIVLAYRQTEVAIMVLGVYVFAAVVLVPAFVLFMRDRRRQQPGPPRCACGYNLTGNVSGICPECGTAIAKS